MLVLKIALRNLWRQKRRNILLGIAIAVCMSILVVTFAFSHGISDILLNKIVINMTGHISVTVQERGEDVMPMIRDKYWLMEKIKSVVKEPHSIRESVSTSFSRVIGNGKSGNMVIVGMPATPENMARETVLEGDLENFMNGSVRYPIAIYKQTSDDLNVKVGDVIRSKFETIYGQSQSARFQVVAILGGGNLFSSFVAFIPIEKAKELMNLEDSENQGLTIVFDDLDNAAKVVKIGDDLHKALITPVEGYGVKGPGNTDLTLYGYSTYENKIRPLFDVLLPGSLKPPVSGKEEEGTDAPVSEGFDPLELGEDRDALFLSKSAAEALKAEKGSEITLSYEGEEKAFTVLGIFEDKLTVTTEAGQTDWSLQGTNPVIVMEDTYYLWRLAHSPEKPVVLAADHPATNLMAGEYKLLDRVRTSDGYMEKFREISNKKMKGSIVDVGTMYEMASQVLEMEAVFMGIIVVVMLILFTVIFIGIINTLRMSIKERTREIGTIRAIGMQRKMVQNTFVAEVVILTIIACIVGILLGLLVWVQLFGSIYINVGADNPLSMLFINNHLHFVPKFGSIMGSMIILVAVAWLFAFLSSKRAAKLKVADALRHFE